MTFPLPPNAAARSGLSPIKINSHCLSGLYWSAELSFHAAVFDGRSGKKRHARCVAHTGDRDHPFRRIATIHSDRSRPVWRGGVKAPSGAPADLGVLVRRQVRLACWVCASFFCSCRRRATGARPLRRRRDRAARERGKLFSRDSRRTAVPDRH